MKEFSEAYEEARAHGGPVSILLGNGFSIGADQSFDYRRLLDRAKFGNRTRSKRIRSVFDLLGTADFEFVVERLEVTAGTLEVYRSLTRTGSTIQADAARVRRALAEVLAAIHPERIGDIGDARLDGCHDFLAQFDEIFTTNYDLILYWAILRKRAHFRDGFRPRDGQLVHAEPADQNVSWLHGAVHLHEELVAGDSPLTVKQQWSAGVPLVDRLREELREGRLPLIVMEGTWRQKQRRINSSPYLSNALQRLRHLEGSLFTYGWGLSENDDHVLNAIQRSGVKHLYVGLHGRRNSRSNANTVGQAYRVRALSGDRVRIRLWSTETASVW